MGREFFLGIRFGSLVFILLISAAVLHAQSVPDKGSSQFPCIQSGFSSEDIVKFGSDRSSNVTVRKRLVELKARCRNGKLIGGNGREIRFYRLACWGNPPADYLDILDKQRKEIAALKKKYTVIEIACDPRAIA